MKIGRRIYYLSLVNDGTERAKDRGESLKCLAAFFGYTDDDYYYEQHIQEVLDFEQYELPILLQDNPYLGY
jgi:hypothetical protein